MKLHDRAPQKNRKYKVSSYLDFNVHYKHGQHSGCVVPIVARKESLGGWERS